MAMEVLGNPILVEMLSILDDTSPAKQQSAVTDGFGATRVLGQIEGYQLYADMLRSFAVPLPSPPEDIPVTWNAGLPEDEPKPR